MFQDLFPIIREMLKRVQHDVNTNMNHQPPTINLIVAADEKNGIGKDNQLPWHLPADLKHFKALTTGYPVIMGRKTYDSIGKPLPGRQNIVITRDRDLLIEGATMAYSITDALEKALGNEVFVIGGANIFEQVMDEAGTLYFTRIHHTFPADAWLPAIDPETWQEEEAERFEPDEKNRYAYSFITYRKRKRGAL